MPWQTIWAGGSDGLPCLCHRGARRGRRPARRSPRLPGALAAAQGTVGSQLALAQHLGVDRTVMTYLLDDLELSA